AQAGEGAAVDQAEGALVGDVASDHAGPAVESSAQGLRRLWGEEIEKMEAEVIVPGGAKQLAADTALALILAKQGRDHASQQPQILRRRAVLQPAVVLPEDDVQHPVQPILDTPVPTAGAAQLRGAAPTAADVVRHLEGLLATLPSGANHPDERLQIHPVGPRAQPLQVIQHQAHLLLFASVTTHLPEAHVVGVAHEVGLDGRIHAGAEVRFQGGLVALDLQQIIRPAAADRLGDVRLATQGIDRYQRPLQFQQAQQLGDGGDLVGLVLDRDLPQGQAVGPDPATDQMQAGAVGAPAAPEACAVDLHLGDAQAVTDGVDPGGETILEDGGCEVAEEVTEGVVGGDAVRQTQAQGAQPGFLGAAEGGHVLEAVGTG